MNYFIDNENIINSKQNLETIIAEKDDFYYPINYKNKKVILSDFELLVIALKSSYYISNYQIEQIMNNSNINKTQLTTYIEKLNEKLIKKIYIKDNLENCINSDFMKMEVLKINYEHFKSTKPERAEQIKKKYNIIRKRRGKRLKRFKKIKIVPSDKDISILLNVSMSKIRYVLTKNFKLYNINTNEGKAN
jgi:DNA-binding transcriptional regulator LsrR (DeoR family)